MLHRAVSALGRAVHAHDRHASCSRRTVPRPALGVGHGCFTDRFAGRASTPNRHVTICGASEDGSIAVLEAPAVIAGLDDVAMMRQAIEHGGGHPGVAEYLRLIGKSRIGCDQQRRVSYSLLIKWNSNWPPGWLNGR
jgi:hypothetical protein